MPKITPKNKKHFFYKRITGDDVDNMSDDEIIALIRGDELKPWQKKWLKHALKERGVYLDGDEYNQDPDMHEGNLPKDQSVIDY